MGVSQGSAPSAHRFTIYLEGMGKDYRSLNDKDGAPHRYKTQPHGQMHTQQFLTTIRKYDKTNDNAPYQIHLGNSRPSLPKNEEAPTREVIYADDANILPEHDNAEKIALRLQQYDIVIKNETYA